MNCPSQQSIKFVFVDIWGVQSLRFGKVIPPSVRRPYPQAVWIRASNSFENSSSAVAREDISKLGIELLRFMDWYSYADIDLITDPRDGRVKIMEVNPHITGSVKICFEAGVEFAKMLVALAIGWRVEAVKGYQVGLSLRHPGLDLIWFWQSKDRFKADPNWFWFLNKKG